MYYLHEDSSLSFQTLGPAGVAVNALKQNDQRDIISTGHGNDEDDENEERSEILGVCSCLDGVIGQLHKQVKALESYQKEPQELVQSSWDVQSKIVDMYVKLCAMVMVTQIRMFSQAFVLTQNQTTSCRRQCV